MSTVCWDGKTLAADSRKSDVDFCEIKRLFKAKKDDEYVLVGMVGDAQDYYAFIEWLADTGQKKPHVENDFQALVINADAKCMVYEYRLYGYDISTEYFAIGSGRDFAVAAMHCGKTAVEAIELASKLDLHTGGEVQSAAVVSREVYNMVEMMNYGQQIGALIDSHDQR